MGCEQHRKYLYHSLCWQGKPSRKLAFRWMTKESLKPLLMTLSTMKLSYIHTYILFHLAPLKFALSSFTAHPIHLHTLSPQALFSLTLRLFGNLYSLIWTISCYLRVQCSCLWFKLSRCNKTVRSVRFVGFLSACYPINTRTRAHNWLNYYTSIRFHHSQLAYHGSVCSQII